MKKIILSLICAITFYSSTIQPANAIVVFDPTNFAVNIKDSIVQGYQLVKETMTTYSSGVTAVQQTLDTVNNRILIPIRDAMTVIMIMKSGTAVQNLILGSLGVEPLLVKNPEMYFKNKALISVEANLGTIAGQNSIYGNSVMSALISTNKYKYADVSVKLNAINQSEIPGMVQKKVCEDATLSRLAREDVLAGSEDGKVDEEAYGDRKRELYRALCTGDPNTNPALASTLNKLSSQRPDIGGWDAWLAVTNGDNAYNKTVQSQLVINQKAQEVIDKATIDLTNGGGIKSLTKCVRYAENDINGNSMTDTATAPCIMEEIQQSASALNSAFQSALGAPLNLMMASFGKGAGSLISTAFTSINLLQGISSAMGNVAGGGGGGGGGGNVSITIGASSTPTNDFAGNQEAKKAIVKPITERLATYAKSLDELAEVNSKILVEINTAKEIADDVQSCYQQLMIDFSITESYPGVSSAISYTRNKKQSTMSLESKVEKDSSAIPAAKAYISDMQARLNVSNSSEEIGDLYTKFEGKISDGTFPSDSAAAIREGEYQTLKMDNQSDRMDGGTAFDLQKKCTEIRQQLTPHEQA